MGSWNSHIRWFAVVALASSIGCEAEPEAKPAKDSGSIINKKTQEIRKADPELLAKAAQGGGEGGAEVAGTEIKANDPLTLSGQAYVRSIDKLAMLSIQHAIDLYEAEHGNYPKTYQEFMDEVIKAGKPDGIWLPMLPKYQEYAYDEANHKLIVLEYPGKKAEIMKKMVR